MSVVALRVRGHGGQFRSPAQGSILLRLVYKYNPRPMDPELGHYSYLLSFKTHQNLRDPYNLSHLLHGQMLHHTENHLRDLPRSR